MSKTVLAAVAAIVTTLSLAACGTSTPSATPTVTVTAQPEASTTPTPTPTTGTPTPTSAKPTPTKAPSYKTLTARQWAKIAKDPDAYIGKTFIVYGEVTQFDSATGTDTFRADVAHKNTTTYGFFEGDNTMLTGYEDDLADVVEGDLFRAKVTVAGSYSYDTQVGGNTTVPMLVVDSIKVIGSTD